MLGPSRLKALIWFQLSVLFCSKLNTQNHISFPVFVSISSFVIMLRGPYLRKVVYIQVHSTWKHGIIIKCGLVTWCCIFPYLWIMPAFGCECTLCREGWTNWAVLRWHTWIKVQRSNWRWLKCTINGHTY